ncbi:hypothetical protein ACTHPH_12390 [Paenibacillus pasadenensis]|nr:hypothetical protein [Paenibacillus pasadenensis]
MFYRLVENLLAYYIVLGYSLKKRQAMKLVRAINGLDEARPVA